MRKLSMDELQRKTPEQFKQAEKTPVIVVLDNIRSMHNVGSVFRTCDAFLIEAIFLCGYTPQPPHRDIQKTALGATETVDWIYFDNTLQAVEQLQARQYKLLAIEQTTGSISLEQYAYDSSQKIALIFGNEVEGVSAGVLQHVHGAIEIPQLGSKHSLNISVAAGIVLWHFFQYRLRAQ